MKKTISLILMAALIALLLQVNVFAAPNDAGAILQITSGISEEASSVPSEASTAPSEAPTAPSEAFTEEYATEAETSVEYATEPETADDTPVPEISPYWLNLYVDSSLVVTNNRIMYIDGDNIYVPAVETADLLNIDHSEVPFSDTIMSLCLSYNDKAGYFFDNNRYAIINGTALALDIPCYKIENVLYVPLEVIRELFGIEMRIDTSVPNPDIYLTSFMSNEARRYNEYVNSAHLTSDTDYLIWVSKGDYAVRLFKRTSAGWSFDREYPCAIGAPGSPTCEGTYKYYQKIAAWRYADFYVGPVMRFNGGYALHSTLIRYDGTMKNDNVRVKISHGCVRLHPADIQYLVDTVPLYTTVHVTAR